MEIYNLIAQEWHRSVKLMYFDNVGSGTYELISFNNSINACNEYLSCATIDPFSGKFDNSDIPALPIGFDNTASSFYVTNEGVLYFGAEDNSSIPVFEWTSGQTVWHQLPTMCVVPRRFGSTVMPIFTNTTYTPTVEYKEQVRESIIVLSCKKTFYSATTQIAELPSRIRHSSNIVILTNKRVAHKPARRVRFQSLRLCIRNRCNALYQAHNARC